MLEKPSEDLLFRPVELGGLGLHNVRCKALAGRLTSFLQTAANSSFQSSALHSALYQYYCCGNGSEGVPVQPPYYSASFFKIIQNLKENTNSDPVRMSLKDWYDYLLKEDVTHQHLMGDPALPLELRRSRVEEQEPDHDWQHSYAIARKEGLDPDSKSFNFKLLNGLLPYRDRVARWLPNSSPACPHCPAPQPTESAEHFYFHCEHNREAGEAVLALVRPVDHSMNIKKALKLDVNCDAMYETMATLILTTGLQLIYNNRKDNKRTSVREVKAELESLSNLLGRARARRLREAASMVRNQIRNFM